MKTEFCFEFDLYDNTAIEDSSVSSDSNQAFGEVALIKEDADFPDYATLEEDYFVLDGSMPEMPDEPDDVVFFSSEMSDENGEFTETPTITISFSENHSCAGLTFYFVGDYPLEMKITWYNSKGYISDSKVFTIDSNVYYASHQAEDFQKIAIGFTKAQPYRYVKPRYIEYGTQIIFGAGGLPIKNASLVEECDPISDKIAINELSFDLIDEDDTYNPGYVGGAHEILQAGQSGTAYEIVDGDKILLGKFFFSEYDDEDNSAGFTFVDYKGLLDSNTFRGGRVYDGEPAGDIIDEIMAVAGITDYTVEDDVRETLLYGWLKIQTCRKALREVLFACGAVAEGSRSTTLDIYKIQKTASYTIKRAKKFSTKVEKQEYISSVSVTYTVYTLSSTVSTIAQGTYSAGTYTVDLSTPASGMMINSGTIVEQTNNYVTFTVDEETDVVITGCKYSSEKLSAVASLSELSAGQTSTTESFSGTLMNATLAMQAAERILTYYELQLGIKTKHLNEGEKVSEWAVIQNPNKKHGGFIGGIEKLTTDLTGGFVSTAEFRGYYNLTTAYDYTTEIFAGDDIGVL